MKRITVLKLMIASGAFFITLGLKPAQLFALDQYSNLPTTNIKVDPTAPANRPAPQRSPADKVEYRAGATTDISDHTGDYPTNTKINSTPISSMVTTESEYDETKLINNYISEDVKIGYDGDTPLDQQVVILTDFGAIVIKLRPDYSPKSVANFIELIKKGFYNNTTFYRMFNNYFMQAGDPEENGTGDSGMKFPNEANSSAQFKRGTVALADADGNPNTTSSQFFITFVRAPWLDNKYNVIGEVISGLPNLTTFFNKYATNSFGIMQAPIPYKIYTLADFKAKFPQVATNMYVIPSAELNKADNNSDSVDTLLNQIDLTSTEYADSVPTADNLANILILQPDLSIFGEAFNNVNLDVPAPASSTEKIMTTNPASFSVSDTLQAHTTPSVGTE